MTIGKDRGIRRMRPIFKVAADAGLVEALVKMREHGVHHLVVEGKDESTGIVSDRDILDKGLSTTSGALRPDLRVSDVMNHPRPLDPQSTLEDAIVRMERDGVSGLPVVQDGKVVGIVTETDLLAHLRRDLTAPEGMERLRQEGLTIASNPVFQRAIELLYDIGL